MSSEDILNKKSEQKQSLLQRYEIPLKHLEFDYIKGCNNGKELERIYHILKSGEEGYYPDLTKCAEERLKLLKPNSKHFRTEVPVLTRNLMDSDEWNEVDEGVKRWTKSIKIKDENLRKNKPDNLELNYPPIRQSNEVNVGGNKSTQRTGDRSNRIKSCDYEKWDKFDADAEVMKMDLTEELNREHAEAKKRENEKMPKIVELAQPEWAKFSDVEREEISLRHKICGNDYYKAKEYVAALEEYSKCVEIYPTATGYNNRAMTYLKLEKFEEVIKDCDRCLNLEPKNIKALLRKGQALFGMNKKQEAYEIYVRVISIEPTNTIAHNQINVLKEQIHLVPKNAFRMKIEENIGMEPNTSQSQQQNEIIEEIDFSKLIVPNKVKKNRIPATAAFGKIQQYNNRKFRQEWENKLPEKKSEEIKLFPNQSSEKQGAFIEEIFE